MHYTNSFGRLIPAILLVILLATAGIATAMPIPSSPTEEEPGPPISGGMTQEEEHLVTEVLFWGSLILVSLLVISI
jgi:hypothetical protein